MRSPPLSPNPGPRSLPGRWSQERQSPALETEYQRDRLPAAILEYQAPKPAERNQKQSRMAARRAPSEPSRPASFDRLAPRLSLRPAARGQALLLTRRTSQAPQ